MKVMGKVTVTLLLMLIVSLFLTSCSGVVTPELQLGLDGEINKVEEIVSVYLEVPYEKWQKMGENRERPNQPDWVESFVGE